MDLNYQLAENIDSFNLLKVKQNNSEEIVRQQTYNKNNTFRKSDKFKLLVINKIIKKKRSKIKKSM